MVHEESTVADSVRSYQGPLYGRRSSHPSVRRFLFRPIPAGLESGRHSDFWPSKASALERHHRGRGVLAYQFDGGGTLWSYGPILVIAGGVVGVLAHLIRFT